MTKRNTPTIPQCFNFLPDKTVLKARDVASIFGYNQQNLVRAYNNGYAPKPKIKKSAGVPCARAFWTLGQIRRFIENNKSEAHQNPELLDKQTKK